MDFKYHVIQYLILYIRHTSISSWRKSLRNKENDDNPDTTDTSHTKKDDTSHTNQGDSIEIVKDMKNTNDDNK